MAKFSIPRLRSSTSDLGTHLVFTGDGREVRLSRDTEVELEQGVHCYIYHNHNVTEVQRLSVAGPEIERSEIGGLANRFPGQHEQIGKIALGVPINVLKKVMDLSGVSN